MEQLNDSLLIYQLLMSDQDQVMKEMKVQPNTVQRLKSASEG